MDICSREIFEILKQKLCEEPVLQYPNFSKPFILITDASRIASRMGGILSQGKLNKDRLIAYASRILNGNEIKYDTYEKKALAIIYCVKHFQPYLYGRKFTLRIINLFSGLKTCKMQNMRILRWRLKLAEYKYDVVYKAGKTNVNADDLSRNPVNFEEADCNIINKSLNPNNPKDAEIISKILEESDKDEEDEDLYVSDDEKIDETLSDDDLPDENLDSILFT